MEEAGAILAKFLLVFGTAFVVSYVLRKSLGRIRRYNEKHEIDNTQLLFIKNSINFIIYTVALVIVLRTVPQFKEVGTSMLAGAGILAAIIGFASQAAFSNIISGVFIVLYKPFRVGDIIEFKDGLKGIVTEITFRHSVIRDFENKRIIIPNTIISNETIINSTIEDEKISKRIFFNIAYHADVDLAMRIIKEEIGNHPFCIDNRLPHESEEDKVVVIMTGWEQSSIQLRANVWVIGALPAFELKCDVFYSIKKRFDAEGIEIPYPYQNVVLKN